MLKFLFYLTGLFFYLSVQASDEVKLLKIEENITQTYSEISTNNSEIFSLKEKIDLLSENIKEKKLYIAKRLLAQKHLKNQNWLLLLDSKNKSSFDRNLKIFKNINQADLLALSEHTKLLKILSAQQKELNKKNEELSVLLSTLTKQEEELKAAEETQLEILQKTKQLDHLLTLKGQLSLPIVSDVINKFGDFHDQNNQYVLLVKGLVMSGHMKQVVSAFGPGKVIFRDVIPYWGESIIIAHKGDYYSVYSALSNVRVKKDDFVKTTQIIAETNGKDFYFELRHKNIPLNPVNWIRKENEK